MKRILFATFATLVATGAFAGGTLLPGGSGPLDVKSAVLAIKSPASNTCPASALFKAWIYTTKAGPISYMTIRKGQGAAPVKTATAKKVGGKYVAEISQTLTILQNTDTQYRIAARGVGDYELSNWVPLKADCGG